MSAIFALDEAGRKATEEALLNRNYEAGDDMISIWQVLVIAIYAGILIPPTWKILKKAGYAPAWSLVVLIPGMNLLCLWYFAFSLWPSEMTAADTSPNIAGTRQKRKNIPEGIHRLGIAAGIFLAAVWVGVIIWDETWHYGRKLNTDWLFFLIGLGVSYLSGMFSIRGVWWVHQGFKADKTETRNE